MESSFFDLLLDFVGGVLIVEGVLIADSVEQGSGFGKTLLIAADRGELQECVGVVRVDFEDAAEVG